MLKKFMLPVIGCCLLLGLVLVVILPPLIKGTLVDSAVIDAQKTVQQFKILRGYYTQNVVGKAKAFGMEPHFDHKDQAERIPLPATMIHDLSSLMSEAGVEIQLYSEFPFPNRANRRLDPFQRDAWDQLTLNPKDVLTHQEVKDGQTVMRVAIADTMQTQGCVACHNSHPQTPKSDWNLGDVRGVLEVTVPLETIGTLMASTRTTIILIVGVGVLAISLIIAWLFNRVVISRVGALSNHLNQLGQGDADLSVQLNESGDDELSNVGKAFNRFVSNFRRLVQNIIETGHTLNNQTESVTSNTRLLSDHFEHQEKHGTHLATAITEMSSTIKSMSDDVEQTSTLTQETGEHVEESQHAVERLVERMRELSDQIGKTVGVIERLNEESTNIGSVLDVIKAISEQTNLLALNAAIEAARAGEQGRGFAVVAEEVRALAHRTQESIDQIADTVESLQSGARQSVDMVTRGQEQVNDAMEVVQGVSDRLREALAKTTQIVEMISGNATAMEEQANVSSEMDKNVTDLTHLITEAHTLLAEVTELTRQNHDLSNELQQQLKQFKGIDESELSPHSGSESN